jgi:hypothetical protein
MPGTISRRVFVKKLNMNLSFVGIRASVPIGELLTILLFGLIAFIWSAHYDILEAFFIYSRGHEKWNLDELLITFAGLFIAIFLFSINRWRETIISEQKLQHRNEELESALAEIRHLRGILPICSSCKKIRDDKGYWHQVEAYLLDHSEIEFSHGICPDCFKRLYPDYYQPNEAATDDVLSGSD